MEHSDNDQASLHPTKEMSLGSRTSEQLSTSGLASAGAGGPPIDRVAPELLAEILWLYCIEYDAMSEGFRAGPQRQPQTWFFRSLQLDDGITIQFQRNLMVIRQISQRWYNIVESTPRLWSVISAFDPLEVIERALVKSGDNALKIRGEFAPDDILEAQAYINTVCPHLHRWEGAELTLPSNIEVAWLENPAPRLREFKLRLGTEESHWPVVGVAPSTTASTHGQINLFRENAPLLQKIEIIGHTMIRLDSPVFDHLKEMSLTDIQLSTYELLMVLQRNPNIDKLALTGWDFDNQSYGLVDTIDLPHLSVLEIWRLASDIIQEILLYIRAPCCVHVSILPSKRDGNEHSLNASWLILHLPKCFLALLETPSQEIMAMYVQDRLRVLASGAKQQRSITRNDVHAAGRSFLTILLDLPGTPSGNQAELQLLPWFASIYPSANVTFNILRMPGDTLLGIDEVFLASIPNTTTLSLFGYLEDRYLLDILSTPATVDERPMRLLPRLQALAIQAHQSLLTRNDVLNLVKARYAGTPGLESPVPFTNLDIMGLDGRDDQEVYEALRDLVGVGVLRWKN